MKLCAFCCHIGLLALSFVLCQCSAPQHADFKQDLIRDLQQTQKEKEAGMAGIRRGLATAPPDERPAAMALGAAFERLVVLQRQTLQQRLALANALPSGYPCTPAMLGTDPNLSQHRAWLATTNRINANDTATNQQFSQALKRESAAISQRFGSQHPVARLMDVMLKHYEASLGKARQEDAVAQAMVRQLTRMVDFLSARKGHWGVVGDQLYFSSERDTLAYNKLGNELGRILSSMSAAPASTTLSAKTRQTM